VVGVARSGDRLRSLADELGGSNMTPIAADVTDAGAMEAMAAEVTRRPGVPDVIVANAGIGLDARFDRATDDAIRDLFEVNILGLVRTVRPFLPAMVERGSGRLLWISSIVGKRGVPHYSAYSASKFALHGMADGLHAELHGSGVTLGLVCPSSTASEFQDRLKREGPAQRRVRPRQHSADSVARAIVRMATSRRREIVLGVEAKLLVLADTLFPTLVDRLLARMLTRK
jgi:short-subunit dehydrogenase